MSKNRVRARPRGARGVTVMWARGFSGAGTPDVVKKERPQRQSLADSSLVEEFRSLLGVAPVIPVRRQPLPPETAGVGRHSRTVYWLARRWGGHSHAIVEYVLMAGYTEAEAETVARTLAQEDGMYPFFYCDRLLEVLELLKQHVQVVRKTTLQTREFDQPQAA